MAAKPAVDGLEQDLRGRARVLRLNIQEPAGREASRRFGVPLVPAFVLFDGSGQEVARFRGAVPARGEILAAIAGRE